MGVAGKEQGEFFRGFQFLHKKINANLKDLKTKEVYKQKCFLSVNAKNLNWETLSRIYLLLKYGIGAKGGKFQYHVASLEGWPQKKNNI